MSWFHVMILFRSLSKFPCSLLCVVRFLLFVDEWIGSPQSGCSIPQVLLRIPDYEASTCYGNLLFLLIVTFCMYIYVYLYSHTGIHMLQSMMLALRDIPITHHMKVQQQRTRYCNSIFQLSTYFNILSLSCWFWGVRKLAPAQLPTCSINSLMLLKSCLGILKSATLVLQQKSRFTDGFFLQSFQAASLVCRSSEVPPEGRSYPLGEAHNFFQHGTVLGCTWLTSCKVMRKDQRFSWLPTEKPFNLVKAFLFWSLGKALHLPAVTWKR